MPCGRRRWDSWAMRVLRDLGACAVGLNVHVQSSQLHVHTLAAQNALSAPQIHAVAPVPLRRSAGAYGSSA
eukprot:1851265-Alexandrium_andersonii.AAC.1